MRVSDFFLHKPHRSYLWQFYSVYSNTIKAFQYPLLIADYYCKSNILKGKKSICLQIRKVFLEYSERTIKEINEQLILSLLIENRIENRKISAKYLKKIVLLETFKINQVMMRFVLK